jgi:hypothetical protein
MLKIGMLLAIRAVRDSKNTGSPVFEYFNKER